MDIDHRQLQYFICLHEKGSMTRAAAELGIMQPALSIQIARLEKRLDTRLFKRSSRGVQPTEAGERYYNLLAPVFRDLRRVEQIMLDAGGEVTGNIKAGITPSLCVSILPAAMSVFLKTYPGVSVEVTESYSENLCDLVADGTLDLALVFDPGSKSEFSSELVVQEPLYLVSAAGAPEPRDSIDLKELKDIPLILMSKRYSVRNNMDRHLARIGVAISPRLELNGLVPTIEMVKMGLGSAILAPITVLHEVNAGTLRMCPIVNPSISRSLVAIHMHRRPLTVAADRFLACIKNEVTALLRTQPHSPR